MRLEASKRFVLVFACAFACVPAVTFAAYNDVTLTTDAVISVGGYTLNVSGSSAVIQSIVVNGGSFSVTLASGSSLTVSSPTLNQLSSDITSDVTNNTCTGSASSISLAYSGAGTVTNVITPSAAICAGSGGGGGLVYGSGPLAPGYVNTNSTATSTTGSVVANAPTTNVPTLVSGGAGTSTTTWSFVFTHNLSYRMVHSDVPQLQRYLNTHGFQIAAAGSGSPGNETTRFGLLTYRALIKFQAAHALPATGFFGPLTRKLVSGSPAVQ